MEIKPNFVVIISADAEWRVVVRNFLNPLINHSPLGEWFIYSYKEYGDLTRPIIFLHGGWGKVAAASSTQFAVSTWKPKLLINLGTCGGFYGEIKTGEIILVERTIIYDIFEQMGDPEGHINHYSTEIDNSWLIEPLPLKVKPSLLLSADRDLLCKDISLLKTKYGAIAGDWESGAIAWVAKKNHTRCLILRGVTDLVGENGGQAYNGKVDFYHENTELIMNKLIASLPEWLLKYRDYFVDEIRGVNTQE
jgi:adenosylhomocysteine nucleosidase